MFVWLHRVLVAARGIFVVVHRLFVVAHGLLAGCGAWALERMGSVVAASGLSCPAACGILVPQPEIEPTSLVLEGGFFFFFF